MIATAMATTATRATSIAMSVKGRVKRINSTHKILEEYVGRKAVGWGQSDNRRWQLAAGWLNDK